MKHDRQKSGMLLLLMVATILGGACYAPPSPMTMGPKGYHLPVVDLTPIVDVDNTDLDALRAVWLTYPMGNNHTRARNYQNGSQGLTTITPYRGVNTVGPDKPPSTTVLFAHITNRGSGVDAIYNFQPSSSFEYYVVVDRDPNAPTTTRWRILEMPSGPKGRIQWVQGKSGYMSGHLQHCANHAQKPIDEADFWDCSDPDDDHASAFSSATALASAGTMPVGREFWKNVFKSESKVRANNGNEPAWASCAGGCCTLIQ